MGYHGHVLALCRVMAAIATISDCIAKHAQINAFSETMLL